jgi:hypothetical protein
MATTLRIAMKLRIANQHARTTQGYALSCHRHVTPRVSVVRIRPLPDVGALIAPFPSRDATLHHQKSEERPESGIRD